LEPIPSARIRRRTRRTTITVETETLLIVRSETTDIKFVMGNRRCGSRSSRSQLNGNAPDNLETLAARRVADTWHSHR
jgi:hypothetical protein